jgi:hypothetical protein
MSRQGKNVARFQLPHVSVVLGASVIDASTAVCQYLTGSSSCGYSDKISITATVAGDARANGPY